MCSLTVICIMLAARNPCPFASLPQLSPQRRDFDGTINHSSRELLRAFAATQARTLCTCTWQVAPACLWAWACATQQDLLATCTHCMHADACMHVECIVTRLGPLSAHLPSSTALCTQQPHSVPATQCYCMLLMWAGHMHYTRDLSASGSRCLHLLPAIAGSETLHISKLSGVMHEHCLCCRDNVAHA